MLAGARQIQRALCVLPRPAGAGDPDAAVGMFPKPPQLFKSGEMVNDDPEGATYWKATHGIRLSGMPAFAKTLSDTQRWQITMLVAHDDKLSPRWRRNFATERHTHRRCIRFGPIKRFVGTPRSVVTRNRIDGELRRRIGDDFAPRLHLTRRTGTG